MLILLICPGTRHLTSGKAMHRTLCVLSDEKITYKSEEKRKKRTKL